ncbi:MAG: hypothetical protein VB076_07070 [Synergistaceae bacterium]|nr:hypothetical protein [Synergistaceae bacterium]
MGIFKSGDFIQPYTRQISFFAYASAAEYFLIKTDQLFSILLVCT